MAIELPDDWPARSWVEDTPLVHLETVSEGTTTRWPVASWSSTRELASSALPGQIRAKTGLSVGSAKALIKRDPDDFPWKRRGVFNLTGSTAQLLLAPEGRTPIPTGQFIVADADGDMTTFGVDVELDERTAIGQQKTTAVVRMGEGSFLQSNSQSFFDPAGLIAELARQIGYGVGPVAGTNGYVPILDVPFQGSIAPAYPKDIEFGVFLDVSDAPAYVEMDSRIFMTPSGAGYTAVRYGAKDGLASSMLLTMDLQGEVTINWYNAPDNDGVLSVDLANRADDSVYLAVRSRGANGVVNTNTTLTVNLPDDPDRPHGLQVEMVLADDGTDLTQAQARVRKGPGSAWSAWITHTMTNTPGPVRMEYFMYITPDLVPGLAPGVDARIARFSMVDLDSPHNTMGADEIWTTNAGPTGRLYLEPLLGTMSSPWLDPDLKVWGAMQAIVDAYQGALITDVHGDLRLMNRHTLTGVGIGPERAVDIGKTFEDIPWVMNSEDQADRLVLTYRPTEGTDTFDTWDQLRPIFRAEDVIKVYPGQTEVFFNTEYVYAVGPERLAFYRADEVNAFRGHIWDAYPNMDGTGTRMTTDQLSFSLRQVTTATWVVTITNTGPTCFLVDSTGTPALTIRSLFYYTQLQEETVERGQAAGPRVRTITVDADNYIQTEADANALADFIWARVNQRAWRASTVVAVPDYRLDLGDVIEIVHSRTGVRSNALVTKVHYDGEFGDVSQKLDLVLIPPTWEDFDEAWAADTWADFDALWSPYTWADFDRTPTATTPEQIQEAL